MKNFVKVTILPVVFSVGLAFFCSPVLAADATLSLSPASGEIKEGETLDVAIVVDTDGADISAVDVLINFDPDQLEIAVDDSQTLFSVLSPSVEDIVDNDTGELKFSNYVGQTEDTFSGEGTVLTLKLTAKIDSGTADVTFVAEDGSAQDSNVVDYETVADILSSVTNGSYTLAASAASGGSATPTPTATPMPTPTATAASELPETAGDASTPDTGIGDFSTFFALIGASLLFSGLLLVL